MRIRTVDCSYLDYDSQLNMIIKARGNLSYFLLIIFVEVCLGHNIWVRESVYGAFICK